MTTAVREAPHHDKLTCYTDYGCRLPECKERYNARNRERLRAKRDGTWNVFVDAGPVREHLLSLKAEEVTPCIVAHATGLPKQTVLDFLVPNPTRRQGRRQRTSPEIAATILAVTPDCLGGKIASAGARRRLGALVAAGWPLNHVTTHSGLHRMTVLRVMQRTTIYASTSKAIADAYDKLSTLKPERHGVDKRQAKRARRWAAGNGWATVGYWADRMDVINDPDFEPMYGITRGELIAADGRELLSHGVLIEVAAARLGVTRNHLQQELLRHPEVEQDEAVAA